MSVEAVAWALRQRTGDPRSKVILICLANYADDKGCCWPSQALIAEQTEQSVDTVQRRIADLVTGGFIRRERRRRADGGWSSDLFILLMQLPLPQPAAPPVAAPPLPHWSGTPYRTGAVPPTALERHHRTIIEPSDEPVGATRTREELDRLEERLREAADPALDPTATALYVLTEPLDWLAKGCDLDLDIVPVIRALAGRRAAASIRGWTFFRRAIFETRDKRLVGEAAAGAPPVTIRPNDPYRSRIDPEKMNRLIAEYEATQEQAPTQ